MKKRILAVLTSKYCAYVLAIAGILVYSILSIHYAVTQRSTIDEGLYLYKGYQFATGKAGPYQDYGLRTLYLPLAYLIPGWAQMIFGVGLRTGRAVEILFGLLALIGLGLLVRRMRGMWWATAAIWAAALNPGSVRTYSLAIVQATILCLLVWTLFFSLEIKRHLWQVAIAAVLAGFLLLTRQDLAPVLPILLIYIFWQYGRKYGLIATGVGAIVVLAGHLFFWPEILKAWVAWLPEKITPFLDMWRIPAGAVPLLNTPPTVDARISGVLEGLRFHFIALAGPAIVFIFWPKRSSWKSSSLFRTAVFIAGMFGILLLIHLWAGLGFSVGNGYNASTFSTYVSFFDYLGILIFVLFFPAINRKAGFLRQALAGILILIFTAGIGYGGFDIFGTFLVNIKIPRLKTFFTTGHFASATIPLWDFLSSRFGTSLYNDKLIVSGITGLLIGLLLLLAALLIWKIYKKRRYSAASYGWVAIALFFFIGAVLTPTRLLGAGFDQWDCGGNVIKNFETAGDLLARSIPPGSRLYWDGDNAVAVLLYMPDLIVYPQQLDGKWNYFLAGDSQTLARLNSWDEPLALQWRNESDVIIFQQAVLPEWQAYVETPQFRELTLSRQIPMQCEGDTYFRVFIRKN